MNRNGINLPVKAIRIENPAAVFAFCNPVDIGGCSAIGTVTGTHFLRFFTLKAGFSAEYDPIINELLGFVSSDKLLCIGIDYISDFPCTKIGVNVVKAVTLFIARNGCAEYGNPFCIKESAFAEHIIHFCGKSIIQTGKYVCFYPLGLSVTEAYPEPIKNIGYLLDEETFAEALINVFVLCNRVQGFHLLSVISGEGKDTNEEAENIVKDFEKRFQLIPERICRFVPCIYGC